MSIKRALHDACQASLQQRLAGLDMRLLDLREALENDTKSSAGDKYETSRAMVHQEQEKVLQQQALLRQQQQRLAMIDPQQQHSFAQLGSVVYTNKGTYYLSIALGKVVVDEQAYYALSLAAPLGKVLAGKRSGDRFTFNGQPFAIARIL